MAMARIGRPVRHFAYPYGKATDAGSREFALAKECGFETAVTFRHHFARTMRTSPSAYRRAFQR